MDLLIDEIKALFPIKGNITKALLDDADIMNPSHCVGATLLKLVTADKIGKGVITWGNEDGAIIVNKRIIYITTEEKVEMMNVVNPMTVTFILNDKPSDETIHLEFDDTDLPELLDQTDDSKKVKEDTHLGEPLFDNGPEKE